MPEGDTVYRAARGLHEALAGAVLTRCDIRVPAFASVDLSGGTVSEVISRGKHLLIRIGQDGPGRDSSGGYSIHSHLRMEGSWHLYRHGARWRRPAHQARIVLETADWVAVGFQLGLLDVVPRDREAEVVGHLGPDLLGPDWDAAEAVRRLAARPEEAVSIALFDQRNLAGLGNEYVNELCFLRGMLPTRPIAEADLPATVDLARRLILANRDRAQRVTTGDLRPGRGSWVYGREGKPCRRCGEPILKGRIGRKATELRDSYFCPRCQR